MHSKQHMSGCFSNLKCMALVGIQAVLQELIMQHFYVFQKINLQNFSITWNKINNSSDLLISYLPITQTQIKHMLHTSFKFRVNPYVKIILSKTRENSRLKDRYLKGITIEQLFIISIQEIILSPLYFIQLLKTYYHIHFLFCFYFQIAPYYYNYIYLL